MALIKMGASGPAEDLKRAALHDAIWYEFVFAFGVPAHDQTDYCIWETVNFTRMGHARALYSFFETPLARRRYPDDVLSEDYGFKAIQIDLAKEDRERLNKDLFHITYARLRHSPETKPWPSSILSNLHAPSVEFINYVLGNQELFNNGAEIPKWTQLRDFLCSGRELKISASLRPDGKATYRFGLGNPLPDGKPVLTNIVGAIEIT